MRISDWSSDVCSSDLDAANRRAYVEWVHAAQDNAAMVRDILKWDDQPVSLTHFAESTVRGYRLATSAPNGPVMITVDSDLQEARSEEHTSELQSLMRISYAVFCLKKKKNNN